MLPIFRMKSKERIEGDFQAAGVALRLEKAEEKRKAGVVADEVVKRVGRTDKLLERAVDLLREKTGTNPPTYWVNPDWQGRAECFLADYDRK